MPLRKSLVSYIVCNTRLCTVKFLAHHAASLFGMIIPRSMSSSSALRKLVFVIFSDPFADTLFTSGNMSRWFSIWVMMLESPAIPLALCGFDPAMIAQYFELYAIFLKLWLVTSSYSMNSKRRFSMPRDRPTPRKSSTMRGIAPRTSTCPSGHVMSGLSTPSSCAMMSSSSIALSICSKLPSSFFCRNSFSSRSIIASSKSMSSFCVSGFIGDHCPRSATKQSGLVLRELFARTFRRASSALRIYQ